MTPSDEKSREDEASALRLYNLINRAAASHIDIAQALAAARGDERRKVRDVVEAEMNRVMLHSKNDSYAWGVNRALEVVNDYIAQWGKTDD